MIMLNHIYTMRFIGGQRIINSIILLNKIRYHLEQFRLESGDCFYDMEVAFIKLLGVHRLTTSWSSSAFSDKTDLIFDQ